MVQLQTCNYNYKSDGKCNHHQYPSLRYCERPRVVHCLRFLLQPISICKPATSWHPFSLLNPSCLGNGLGNGSPEGSPMKIGEAQKRYRFGENCKKPRKKAKKKQKKSKKNGKKWKKKAKKMEKNGKKMGPK